MQYEHVHIKTNDMHQRKPCSASHGITSSSRYHALFWQDSQNYNDADIIMWTMD